MCPTQLGVTSDLVMTRSTTSHMSFVVVCRVTPTACCRLVLDADGKSSGFGFCSFCVPRHRSVHSFDGSTIGGSSLTMVAFDGLHA